MGGKKSFVPLPWLIRVSHISLVKVTSAGPCQGSLAESCYWEGHFGTAVCSDDVSEKWNELIRLLRTLWCFKVPQR